MDRRLCAFYGSLQQKAPDFGDMEYRVVSSQFQVVHTHTFADVCCVSEVYLAVHDNLYSVGET